MKSFQSPSSVPENLRQNDLSLVKSEPDASDQNDKIGQRDKIALSDSHVRVPRNNPMRLLNKPEIENDPKAVIVRVPSLLELS
jgi:hypothetical protein